ncbi:DUF488 domain-containing protein [bacterium]|nr:DUF488 domain-containing protein [bacterium]
MNKTIYTIGHSNHDPDTFIRLLKKYRIEALIDVRSQPYSSYVKHFNKEALKTHLKKHKIDYYYGGAYLGGRPSDESVRRDGKVDYELLRKKESYIKALRLLLKLVSLKMVVLMCSEEDPARCHRSTLMTPDLIKKGYEIRDIRADGSYEVAELKPVQLELPQTETKPTSETAST